MKLGLLSRQMYADSSLVKANVSGHHLSHSGMSVDEFKNKAVEENGDPRQAFWPSVASLDNVTEDSAASN